MHGERLGRRLALVGHVAGQHLVEDAAERVQVDAVIGRLPRRLLGRHVLGRAQHHAGEREPLLGGHVARDAEVDDLHHVLLPVALEHEDVLRLEIAVDDPLVVRCLQPARDLHGNRDRLLGPDVAALVHLAQRRPVEKLHHEVGVSVGQHAEVGDVDDVLVPDLRRRLGLDQEPLDRGGVLRVLLLEHLDGDALVDDGVARGVDEAHAALADHRLDDVAPVDGRADQRVVHGLRLVRIRRQAVAVARAELNYVGVVDIARATGLHGPIIYHKIPAARSIAEQECCTKSMRM